MGRVHCAPAAGEEVGQQRLALRVAQAQVGRSARELLRLHLVGTGEAAALGAGSAVYLRRWAVGRLLCGLLLRPPCLVVSQLDAGLLRQRRRSWRRGGRYGGPGRLRGGLWRLLRRLSGGCLRHRLRWRLTRPGWLGRCRRRGGRGAGRERLRGACSAAERAFERQAERGGLRHAFERGAARGEVLDHLIARLTDAALRALAERARQNRAGRRGSRRSSGCARDHALDGLCARNLRQQGVHQRGGSEGIGPGTRLFRCVSVALGEVRLHLRLVHAARQRRL